MTTEHLRCLLVDQRAMQLFCQGHCRGGRHSQTGCEDDRPAVDTCRGARHGPPSVCFVHEGGV